VRTTQVAGFLAALLLLAGSSSRAASTLEELARRSRERRRQSDVRVYSDADLKAHHESTVVEKPLPEPPKAPRATTRSNAPQDRAYWRREKEKLDRDLARLDDERRRLELRLAELRARAQSRARRPPDPADAARRTVLEGSIAEVRGKSAALLDAFLERGRRSGALPGWLR